MRRTFYENDAYCDDEQDKVEYAIYCEDHQDEVQEECVMEAQDQNFIEGDSYNESKPNMEEYDGKKEPTLHHDWITYVNMKIALLEEEVEDQFLGNPNLQEGEDTLMEEWCYLAEAHPYENEYHSCEMVYFEESNLGAHSFGVRDYLVDEEIWDFDIRDHVNK